MSPLNIASTAYSLLSALGSSGASSSASAAKGASHGDFASSLALRIASQRTDAFSSLLGTLSGDSGIGLTGSGSNDLFAALGLGGSEGNLSAFGRNLSLFDPESGYRMMTEINRRDVTYQAQFAELSEMESAVGEMQRAGETLAARMGDKTTAADDAALAAELQSFVASYNDWVGRFEGTVQAGGLLAGTQAAEISLYELKQSIENVFNGASHGIRGMGDIGLRIDPATRLASLDGERLQSVLTSNRNGVVAAVGEFGRHFARSAELLISDNNFIPNRLDNLDRAIDYIADNKTALQSEFGLGDPARLSPVVAKALSAYQRMLAA